jgi:uncharacterized membrane protein
MKKIILLLSILILSCSSKPLYEKPPIKGDKVVISLSQLEDSRPRFFSIILNQKRVNFFVLKIGDKVESYLDACIKCYPHKMGFKSEGFYLVCKYCGVRYPLDTLNTGIGSCYPIPLSGTLQGEEYIIPLENLKEAKKYF